jgi:hypothetical protein
MALATAVLLTGAGRVCYAQSEPGASAQALPATSQSAPSASSGSLSGRLTGLYSNPLEGVEVVARNQATGTEARATTAKNGAFLFPALEPGLYTLEAVSAQMGRGQLEEIVVAAGHEARVQAAMSFEPLPPSDLVEAALHPKPLDLETTTPEHITELEFEPLLRLSVSRWAAFVVGERLETTTPEQITELEFEQLLRQSLSRWAAFVVGEPLETTALATMTQLEYKPLLRQSVSWDLPPQTAVATATPQVVPTQRVPPSATPLSKPVLAAPQQSAPAASGTTMSAAELQALPVSGRRWQDFVLDNTPTSVTPAGGQAETALRGAGQQTAEIAVDGVSRGLAFGSTNGPGHGSSGQGALGQGGDPAGMARIGSGGHGIAMSEAAIRAVETAAGNVEAEASRSAGGRIHLQTQTGANELHGQGFAFDRGNLWGAQNPFTQWVKEGAPATETAIPVFTPVGYTPPDRETVWGIGVGSRIRRDKLFWFAALDSYNRNDPGLATVKHPYLAPAECEIPPCSPIGFFAQPSNDQMQVLSARLGLSSNNPVAEGVAAYSSMLETLAGLLGPAPRSARQWTGFGRLDWQAAERHRFTLEGIGADWNSPGGGLTRVSETYGNHSFGSSEASEKWLLGRWEAFVTPNLLAVTQASAGGANQQARPSTPSALEQSFLCGNVWGQLPQFVVDNRYGFTIGNPSRFGQGSYPDEHLYHGQESLDWIRGKLLVKAGFELNHNTDATSLLRNQTGTYTYSNVENFISDALAFQNFPSDPLDPNNQHNCDQTGKVWRDSSNQLRGLGYLPCYSYYSQTIGPTNWHLTTNDWGGYATAQWEANKLVVISAGLRWEQEQLPPPIAALQNPELPLTEKLPSLGNNWGPRIGLAVGSGEKRWPVLRLGYGMYFARTPNSTIETALTQTGSLNGDLSFFMRPTDNLNAGGAPPFPAVLAGEPASVVKPGAVEFAPNFHNSEIHQAEVAVEERLPGHVEATASAVASLGRRLPVSIDANFDPSVNPGSITYAVVDATGAGPIKAAQITVPFYASWPAATGFAGRLNPDYQQISEIESRANSTYEAAMLRIDRYGRRGLSLHAHYTYAHAMDWNPNESAQAAGNDVLDPADFRLEYGTSNLDVRHSAGATVIWEAPWKLHRVAGRLGNGWMASGVGLFRSGLPYTLRTSGSLAEEFATGGAAIVALGPGMNGSGGDNRVYGVGSNHIDYNIGRNTYRYPATWKADLRLAKSFDLGELRKLEVLAESFNLFNHQNVTELETTGYYLEPGNSEGALPTLNFLTGPVTNPSTGNVTKANTTAFGQPLNINATNFYRERQLQFGLRMRF